MGAGRDGSLGGAVAEVDIDDADGFERRQGFGGGEIEARGLELLFDGAVDQQGNRAKEGNIGHRPLTAAPARYIGAAKTTPPRNSAAAVVPSSPIDPVA